MNIEVNTWNLVRDRKVWDARIERILKTLDGDYNAQKLGKALKILAASGLNEFSTDPVECRRISGKPIECELMQKYWSVLSNFNLSYLEVDSESVFNAGWMMERTLIDVSKLHRNLRKMLDAFYDFWCGTAQDMPKCPE